MCHKLLFREGGYTDLAWVFPLYGRKTPKLRGQLGDGAEKAVYRQLNNRF